VSEGDWREGHALLAARLATIQDAVARTAGRRVPALDLGTTPVRRVVATGVGSSAAHAALLVHELRRTRRDAAVVPLSMFLAPPPAAPDDVLVVFSQGLSPNARLALVTADRWRRVVVVTAVTDEARLAPLRATGVVVHTIDGADEFGTLVRVVGPMTGYVAALALASALGGPAMPEPAALAAAVAESATPDVPADAFGGPLALVTSGTYGELVSNLAFKVMEGLLVPMPPVWDVLHLVHGPFQERFAARATFLALTRPDAPGEDDALDRFAAMLDPSRHALIRMPARFPSPRALLEHEVAFDRIVLRAIAARAVDQVRWPGRDRDAPLYQLARPARDARLARCVWPELDGVRTAIVPLGATEQHGPHLPFATDTLIADALAARLAARVDGAVALPALALGCSREHLGFPGTLDLSADTLVAVLADVLRSLARHGIAEAFVFSAHGGNVATLAAALPRLRASVPAIRIEAATDLDALTARLRAQAHAFGVSPEAAGHHAGEVETSIMLALHPELVRTDALAAGYVTPAPDPQALFYPDLRRTSASGTVGDPRGATALRGARYLAVWVEELEAALRKKSHAAAGTNPQ
jgi:creatinine amidohydrolase